MITIQGYTITLTELNCPELSLLKTKVIKIQELLNKEYERIIHNYDDQVYDLIRLGYTKGNFRDALIALTQPQYLKWDIKGNKSRLWRMVSAHTYQQYTSRYKRQQLIKIIQDNNITTINDELWYKIKEAKIKTNNNELLNILKYIKNNKEQCFRTAAVELDYTTGDSNIKQELKHNVIYSKIQCDNDTMFDIYYQLPTHLDINKVIKVSKPIINYDNSTDRLILRYSVFIEVDDNNGDNILGVDLGKIKPFTAAALTPQGDYSQELTYSKEVKQLNNKLSNINTVINSVYNKKKNIEHLLSNNDNDSTTYYKWVKLENEYHKARMKRTRLKAHLSWVIARDVVSHAVDNDCSIIKLEELSWIGNNGGKWDQSLTQSRIEHKANNNGVKISKIDAYGTSWEYPEEYDTNPAPRSHYNSNTRELINSNGNKLDKDYTASIAIAARVDKKKARKRKKKNSTRERSIQPKKCRDKFKATPKRPKSHTLRKRRYSLPVKNTFIVDDLSYSISVGMSNTVVFNNLSQVLSNSDKTMIMACLLLSCNH